MLQTLQAYVWRGHGVFTTSLPMLIKSRKVLGYLTSNKRLQSSISPNLLKALCKDAY